MLTNKKIYKATNNHLTILILEIKIITKTNPRYRIKTIKLTLLRKILKTDKDFYKKLYLFLKLL